MAESQNQPPMNDELLSAYLDDELSVEERMQVEARLRDDEQARELLDQLRSTSEAVRNLPQHTLGYDLREQVLGRAQVQPRSTILDYNSDEYEANDHGSGRRLIYAVAAIAAALLLMFYQGGENPGSDQLAMSENKRSAGAPDVVIRSASPDNTQIAGMGGLSAMFSSRQSKNEVAQADLSSVPSANVELIGDQLLGDAPLEHLHVHLKPKVGGVQEEAFAQLLEEAGVTQMNTPSSTNSESYRAQMILVDAPLLQIRKILLHCQSNDSNWTSVNIRRQSDAAPVLSFFAAEEGELESLGRWLSRRGSSDNSWALYLGSGTEAAVHSEPAVSSAEDVYSASETGEADLGSDADISPDPGLAASRYNLRVLFVLLPADE